MRFRYSLGSTELQQVRLLVRFSLRRLRFSIRTHTSVLLYSDTVRCPGDNSIRLRRTNASITKFRHNKCTQHVVSLHGGHVVHQGHFAEFNGKCESNVVWNSWSRCYAPQMRKNLLPVRIIRRQKASPEDTCTDHPVCCIVGGALGLE